MNMWLVGAGYWGSRLVQDLELLGVTPRVIDIKNGQSIDDIDTLDPVMLATPLWEHYSQVCELLNRGHDVYVEKPMAENSDQIHAIRNCVGPDQLLMVGHLFVHHPQMDEIKSLIAADEIGQLQHISSRRLNWGIYQTKTDPLLSLAVHDISIVLEFIDQSAQVARTDSWHYSNNSNPDRVWFSGQAGTVAFDVDVSWYWPVRTRQTVFIGTQGQIVWDQDANTVTVYKNTVQNSRAVADSAPRVIEYSYALTPLQVELRHWLDCLRTRQQPCTGINDAEAVANIVDQIKSLL
jgi:predicted dehydrogenase